MNEMVERVAKAIFTAHNGLRNHATGLTWEENAVDWEKDEYRAMARGALTELREPTEVMVQAPGGFDDTRAIWKDMIDEAMK